MFLKKEDENGSGEWDDEIGTGENQEDGSAEWKWKLEVD